MSEEGLERESHPEWRHSDGTELDQPAEEWQLLAPEQHQRVFAGMLDGAEVYSPELRELRADLAGISERLWPVWE